MTNMATITDIKKHPLYLKKPKKSIFTEFTHREYPDIPLVLGFLENKMGVKLRKHVAEYYPDEQTHYTHYIAKTVFDVEMEYGGYIPVEYYLSKSGWGRVQSNKSLSMNVFHRPTRHAFANKNYIDFDMVNCQIQLLYELARKADLPTDGLSDYCRDSKVTRKLIAEHYKLADITNEDGTVLTAYEQAKRLPIRLAFGGGLSQWKKDYKVGDMPDMPLVMKLLNTICGLCSKVCEINPHIYADLLKSSDDSKIKKQPKNNKNFKKQKCWADKSEEERQRSLLANYAQTWERVIQEHCIAHLIRTFPSVKIEDVISCQDGFMVLRNQLQEINIDVLLNQFNSIVVSKFHVIMYWEIKPFNEAIQIQPSNNPTEKNPLYLSILEEMGLGSKSKWCFVDSDNEAIDIIMSRLKDSFIYTKNQLYFKDGNKWIHDKSQINDYLLNFILESCIYKMCDVTKKVSPFCQNVASARAVRDGILSKLRASKRDDTAYDKFHTSTTGKVCFEDGVLDFVNKTFVLWKDVPVDSLYTTIIINRKYADYFNNPDRHFIDKIKTDIIGNLFGEKSETALKFFSRAIAGYFSDKNFGSYSGNRNCGKGVLDKALKSAFGNDYIVAFDLENITCKRESNKSSDSAKENAWTIPLQFARVAINQETEENKNGDIKEGAKISNKVIKSVQSGGDPRFVRALYCDPVEIIVGAVLFIMGNTEIGFSGSGDAREHHIGFSGVKQFISDELYQSYLATYGEHFVSSFATKDDTMYDKVRTDNYSNAMVYLLFENFTDKPVSILPDLNDEDTIVPVRGLIFQAYEVTLDDADRVPKEDLLASINADKKKIIAELKEMGCVGDSNCRLIIEYEVTEGGKGVKKSKRVQAFKGLKRRIIV